MGRLFTILTWTLSLLALCAVIMLVRSASACDWFFITTSRGSIVVQSFSGAIDVIVAGGSFSRYFVDPADAAAFRIGTGPSDSGSVAYFDWSDQRAPVHWFVHRQLPRIRSDDVVDIHCAIGDLLVTPKLASYCFELPYWLFIVAAGAWPAHRAVQRLRGGKLRVV
jgi:hypothetical protein